MSVWDWLFRDGEPRHGLGPTGAIPENPVPPPRPADARASAYSNPLGYLRTVNGRTMLLSGQRPGAQDFELLRGAILQLAQTLEDKEPKLSLAFADEDWWKVERKTSWAEWPHANRVRWTLRYWRGRYKVWNAPAFDGAVELFTASEVVRMLTTVAHDRTGRAVESALMDVRRIQAEAEADW